MTCYHEVIDKNGNKTGRLAKCASDPCSIPGHASTDIHADNIEQAYSILNTSNNGENGIHNTTVFFDSSMLNITVNENIPNRHELSSETRKPHLTFSSTNMPDNDGMSINGFKVIGYGNDGKNEGLLVEIPAGKFHGLQKNNANNSIQAYITLSLAKGANVNDTAKLDFKPLDTPFIVNCGTVKPKRNRRHHGNWRVKSNGNSNHNASSANNAGNNALDACNTNEPLVNKIVEPRWHGGAAITRRHFNGAVNGVDNIITLDDWKHLSELNDSIMEIQKHNRNKRVIQRKIKEYLESDDENAAKFRAYCGADVSMDDISTLMTNNVGAMTRRYTYSESGHRGTDPSLKRCMLSNTSNDMNKRKYIASIMFFGGRCCYCGMPLHKGIGRSNDPQAATGEHLDPIGGNPPGETKFGNMALCCRHCNEDKADKPLVDWIQNTKMLTTAQKLSAVSGIKSFRDLSFYEGMSAVKARAVNEALERIKAFKHAHPGNESVINNMLNHETMRIQQMQ
jgi:hypothetical protein